MRERENEEERETGKERERMREGERPGEGGLGLKIPADTNCFARSS